MFKWIRSLFGGKTLEDKIKEATQKEINEEFKVELDPADRDWVYEGDGTKVKKDQAEETVSEEAVEETVVDELDTLNKKQLLALCKERGIKANASLKKDELLTRLE